MIEQFPENEQLPEPPAQPLTLRDLATNLTGAGGALSQQQEGLRYHTAPIASAGPDGWMGQGGNAFRTHLSGLNSEIGRMLDALQQTSQTLRGYADQIETARDEGQQQLNSANEQMREANQAVRQTNEQLTINREQLAQAEAQLTETQAQIAMTEAEIAALQASAAAEAATVVGAPAAAATEAEIVALTARLAELEAQAAMLSARVEALNAEIAQLQARLRYWQEQQQMARARQEQAKTTTHARYTEASGVTASKLSGIQGPDIANGADGAGAPLASLGASGQSIISDARPVEDLAGRPAAQQMTHTACGAAAMQNVGDTLGVSLTQREWAQRGWITASGGNMGSMAGGLNSALGQNVYSYEKGLNVETLSASVNSGKPAIVSLETGGKGLHAVTVDRITGNAITYRDPLTGMTYTSPLQSFLNQWTGEGIIATG